MRTPPALGFKASGLGFRASGGDRLTAEPNGYQRTKQPKNVSATTTTKKKGAVAVISAKQGYLSS
jgi:hypothetical protein